MNFDYVAVYFVKSQNQINSIKKKQQQLAQWPVVG